MWASGAGDRNNIGKKKKIYIYIYICMSFSVGTRSSAKEYGMSCGTGVSVLTPRLARPPSYHLVRAGLQTRWVPQVETYLPSTGWDVLRCRFLSCFFLPLCLPFAAHDALLRCGGINAGLLLAAGRGRALAPGTAAAAAAAATVTSPPPRKPHGESSEPVLEPLALIRKLKAFFFNMFPPSCVTPGET